MCRTAGLVDRGLLYCNVRELARSEFTSTERMIVVVVVVVVVVVRSRRRNALTAVCLFDVWLATGTVACQSTRVAQLVIPTSTAPGLCCRRSRGGLTATARPCATSFPRTEIL